ncbi:hypothetical protein D6C99_03048 [Aureobasidium pullulans]|nr:hypothetical protein D6C99_03048 [Aureobasidium pullulans]
MSDQSPPLLRPRPRRPFDLTPMSSTAGNSPDGRDTPDPQSPGDESGLPPSRTRSFLNLTTSTLFGIYSPAGYAPDRDETPWGTGAQTPIDSKGMNMADIDGNVDDALMMRSKRRRGSMLEASTRRVQKPKKKTFKNWFVPMVGKNVVLGLAGIAYGQLIAHLHDRQTLVPVQVEGMPSESWAYIAYWCFSGIALGQALPWVDAIWMSDGSGEHEAEREYRTSGNLRSAQDSQNRSQTWTPGWNEIVRFIGAAVGIVFAIVSRPFSDYTHLYPLLIISQRRLPWQSPLQLSLTLALANPAIWYLLDRTGPCFILATTVALSGTGLLLSINPELIPSPHAANLHTFSNVANATANAIKGQDLVLGTFTLESVGVATWIASVLFVSAVAFGNIGRRL